MTLTKQQIIDAPVNGLQSVHVPEWGGNVYLKPPSQADFESFLASVPKDAKGNYEEGGLPARFVILCATDENGVRLFSDDDFDTVNAFPAKVVSKLQKSCQDLCGIDEMVEAMVGKSETTGS
tara:strand:+ start:649 stop:1014 length:366 start_codon:yes stop_codon:yes gene_type:complete